MRMRTRSTVLATFGSVVLASGVLPGCGQEKSTPGLMLAFTSDMSVPKDVSAVGLYIRSRTGTVIYNNVVDAKVDPSGNRTVRFPSTFAVLSNGSPATVRVQLIAYGAVTETATGTSRKAIVMRESTTGVPTDRLSLLRMPLLWINQGSVGNGSAVVTTAQGTGGLSPLSQSIKLTADETLDRPESGYKSPCTEDQAWIGGKCRTIDPTAPLPDYTEADKPGGENSICFNVEACYSEPTSLLGRIRDDGTVDLGSTKATLVNLALITKDQVGIKLPDGRFAISLDSDSEFEGFTIVKDQIVLSEAVREAIKSGRAVDLVATSACAVKTADVGNCGPWNPGATAVVPTPGRGEITLDGGPLADAGRDAPLGPPDGGDGGKFPDQGEAQGAPEPKLMGLALDSANIYTVRDGFIFQPDFNTDFRFIVKGNPSKPDVMGETSPIGGIIDPGLGYRVTRITFGPMAAFPWTGKTFRVIYKARIGLDNAAIYLNDENTTTLTNLTVPVGFAPIGVIATKKGPVFVGPSGVSAGIIGYGDLVTALPTIMFTGLSGGETPTAILPSGPPDTAGDGFHLGTSTGRVMSCAFDGAYVTAACNQNAAAGQGTVVDIAQDPTSLFALLVRPSGGQQNYEGVYQISGNQFVARATRNGVQTLHFEPAGTGADAGVGRRNRIALAVGAHGFVTSAPDNNIGPSEVFRFDRNTPQTATAIATNLTRALDIAADASHVYYVDYGTGTKADGRVYRLPLN